MESTLLNPKTAAYTAPAWITPKQMRYLRQILLGRRGSAFRNAKDLARFKRDLNKIS